VSAAGSEAVVLVVRLTVEPGTEDEAVELMRALAEASRQEPGCEVYSPCRVNEGDGRSFVFYERYSSQSAFDEHAASEHFDRYAKNGLFKIAESRERMLCEPV
jgi:quinol monooxygenase YgiN